MNRVPPYQSPKSFDPRCADALAIAEQELTAFFKVVTRRFGSEEAKQSAEDWLHEFIEIDGLPASAREWRSITIKASTRLASRVTVPDISTELTNA